MLNLVSYSISSFGDTFFFRKKGLQDYKGVSCTQKFLFGELGGWQGNICESKDKGNHKAPDFIPKWISNGLDGCRWGDPQSPWVC